jgi:hypothetical protein
MKANNFWGKSRSSGVSMGMIVRLGLALAAVAGSLALAWTLLSSHQRAHATSTANEISTSSGTITNTPTPTSPSNLPPGPVNTTWYFAEGKVGQGFTEYLTIQNPDPVNTCNVNIEYLLSAGSPASKSLTVLPNTRWTEGVNNDLNTRASSVSSQPVSTIVTVTNANACKGVVVERPIYFTNFMGISSGTDALGATKLGTDFYFADVSTPPSYHSYITILNPPSGMAATITITYYSAGAMQGTDTLVVQHGNRGTIIPKNLNERAATWVHSDQPVVVERPTYFKNYSYSNAQTGSCSQKLYTHINIDRPLC